MWNKDGLLDNYIIGENVLDVVKLIHTELNEMHERTLSTVEVYNIIFAIGTHAILKSLDIDTDLSHWETTKRKYQNRKK